MKSEASFTELVNMAARDLPLGSEIVLRVENGFAGVELWRDGEEVNLNVDEMTVEDAFIEAVSLANNLEDQSR